MHTPTISIHVSEQTVFNHDGVNFQPNQHTNAFGTRLSNSYQVSPPNIDEHAFAWQQTWIQQAQTIITAMSTRCLQLGHALLRDDATWFACASLLLLWGAERFIL